MGLLFKLPVALAEQIVIKTIVLPRQKHFTVMYILVNYYHKKRTMEDTFTCVVTAVCDVLLYYCITQMFRYIKPPLNSLLDTFTFNCL